MFICVVIAAIGAGIYLAMKGYDDAYEWDIQEDFPYYKKKFFFSPREREYFLLLSQTIKELYWDKYVIFWRVRIADILKVDKKLYYERRDYKYFNQISNKHIDYLICSNEYFNPLLAIELQDSSHLRADRARSDIFKQKAFEAVWLPLICEWNIDHSSIMAALQEHLK